MGFQETVLGTPGQTQVHQTGATRPPGYGMARDVYSTLMDLMNRGVPFPTYQGQLDPGLSPTLQNSLRMAQGFASSSPQEALAGVNGSIGRFMNPNYSNPSGSSGSGLGGSMPFSGQFRPDAPTFNGGQVGQYDLMGSGSAPPAPRQPGNGGMMSPPSGSGGGMSMGGMFGPNNPMKPPGSPQGQQGGGGMGWGPPSGQSPPWAPPMGVLSNKEMPIPMRRQNNPGFKDGMDGGQGGAPPMMPSRMGRYPNPNQPPMGPPRSTLNIPGWDRNRNPMPPAGGMPPGGPVNFGPPRAEVPMLAGTGMPYGNDGRPMPLPTATPRPDVFRDYSGQSWGQIMGSSPGTSWGSSPYDIEAQPNFDLMSYLRTFLQNQGG